MKQTQNLLKKSYAILLSFILILSLFSPSYASASDDLLSNQKIDQNLVASTSTEDQLKQMIQKTVDYYQENKTELSSWQEMVALWGAGEDLTDGSWQLPEWKTTDPKLKPEASGTNHIQYIFGLLTMGEDPSHAWETDRNLYAELAAQQQEDGSIGGINKHLYAMLALHTGKKLGHDVGTWNEEKEQKALDFLLKQEINGGGFALSGTYPDTDMTGMVLLTLGLYQDQSAVQAVIERAKDVLKTKQLDNAGFKSDGTWGSGDNSNSLSAAISGLVAVNEDVLSDNWVKDGKTVADSYERFHLEDGSFKFKETDQNQNLAATEQALISLLDIQTGKSVWYRITEIELPIKEDVQLSIEGIISNILPQKDIKVVQGQTALDVLKQVLNEAKIEYVIKDSQWGPYIESIDGQAAGSLSGYDGWSYKVNGEYAQVGAGDYVVKDGDNLQFYYGRWATISSTSEITTEDSAVIVTLVGDTFTEEATNIENWKITTGTTGLGLKSIGKVNDQEVKLQFEGTAKNGAISIQALAGALVGESPSNEITITNGDVSSININLTVDGINASILPQQGIKVVQGQTALEVLKQVLNKEQIQYVIEESQWGPYIQSIAGQAGGSLGGYDGWSYKVNGEYAQVGAGDYVVKDGDELQFYYGRWAAISSNSSITSEAINPTVTISLAGDTFTEDVNNLGNWKITTGTTGLAVKSVEKIKDQEVKLQFEGTAKRGTISVQALTGAIKGENPSDPVLINVIQLVSSTEDKQFEIATDEKEVSIKSNEDQTQPTNVVTLKLSNNALPSIEADRGNTTLTIPSGTNVTTTNWNGLLQIPSNLSTNDSGLSSKINSNLVGKEVQDIFVRIKVGGNQKIAFDKHVTLTLKGMADKEAGFIDQSGTFTPIKKYSNSDSQAVDVYSYAQDSDLIIKTKHFTEFLAYQAVQKESPSSGSSGGSGGSSPKNKTVTLSVEKKSIGEGNIISTTTVTIGDNDTPFTVLERVAKEKGISIDYTGSGKTLYVQAIDGLAEFDHGPLSGWMYSVNGNFRSDGVGEYKVKDGDKIRFAYTKELGKDIGNDVDPVTEGQKPSTGGGGSGGSGGSAKNNSVPTAEQAVAQKHIESSANWILKNGNFLVQDDFNDWSVFALERAGKSVPANYYNVIESYVKENSGNFRLVTDSERIALALLALGKDPKNIAGYDLIEKIYQNERMTNQGTNGVVYALLTLDAKNYEVPTGALWTREKLINWILEQQNVDGGFPLSKASNGPSDMDITAMTLQALAKYQDKQNVKEAIDNALSWISKQQLDNGGFKVLGEENSESISQVIIALASLGIDLKDNRFVKKNGNLLIALTSFVNEDGGIAHLRNESSNNMATQQGLMAFAAYDRFTNQTNNLFNMNDNKVQNNKVLFSDITNNTFGQEEIYQLVESGIINGYPDGTFKPNQNINRGQAANLFVRALKLEIPYKSNSFKDISPSSPIFDAAQVTKAAGIFKGSNNGTIFGPLDVLTREQMASVLVRAFNLQPNNVKVNLKDLNHVSESHRKNVEILYQNGITTGRANGEFDPKAPVTRVQFVVFLSRAMALKTNE